MALSGWANRIKLTIDSSKISAALTDFPVRIHLSSSSGISGFDATAIFTELASDANRKKIAVGTDGDVECYVEIDHWDHANQTADLWVKIPSVSDTADTVLYLHYDSSHADNTTYVGDRGETPAQNVWDSDFLAVYHLTDCLTNVYDSTANDRIASENVNSATPYDSLVGKAVDFQLQTDVINAGNNADLQIVEQTVEAICRPEANDRGIICKGWSRGVISTRDWDLYGNGSNLIWWYGDGTGTIGQVSAALPSLNSWHYIAAKHDGTTNADGMGVLIDNNAWVRAQATALNISTANSLILGGSGNNFTFRGQLDEVRISKVARSDAWLEATYQSNFDTLITLEDGTAGQGGSGDPSWLGSWAKRVKFTLASANIGSDLTDFPALLKIAAASGTSAADLTSIFTDIADADRKKIAVTSGDGTTQLYVEIERWDATNQEAYLHVKVPTVSASADTDLYLYFDPAQSPNTAYVGDIGDTPAQNVWNSGFQYVCHMANDPTGLVVESTANGRDFTAYGMAAANLVDGKAGKALDFEDNNDYLEKITGYNPNGDAAFAFEALFYPHTLRTGSGVNTVAIMHAGSAAAYVVRVYQSAFSTWAYLGSAGREVFSAAMPAVNTWHYGAFSWTSGETIRQYLNDTLAESAVYTTTMNRGDCDDLSVGIQPTYSNRNLDGLIGEVRFSNVSRSNDWMQATKKTLFDEIGAYATIEEYSGPVVYPSGYAKRITINIDSSKIDSDLTDFPVLIALSETAGISDTDLSEVFTDIAFADRKKISVTDVDGNELPVEIVSWNETAKTAELWAKVPTVYAAQDTTLYLYFDPAQADNTTYVGDTGETIAATVWSTWYKQVYHLEEGHDVEPVKDSCRLNDLISTIHSGATPVQVAGKIGKALDFEEAENHYKYGATGYDFNGTNAFTLEAWLKPESNSQTYHTAVMCNNVSTDQHGLRLYNGNYNVVAVLAGSGRNLTSTNTPTLGEWQYVASKWANGSNLCLFDGLDKFTAGPYSGSIVRTTDRTTLGDTSYTNGREWDGSIDEVRISHLELSDDMLKANYYSGSDDLVTFSGVESAGGSSESATGGMILCVPVAPVIVPTAAFAKLATVTAGMQAADGKTDLYTVPTGKSAIVTHVIIRNPTASLAGGTDFDLGDGANADTWKTAIDLSGLTAATDAIIIDLNTKFTVFDAGGVFGIMPVTGATADADATIDVFGYEF
jgi:hypothetical protein